MNRDKIREAVEMAQASRCSFITTANREGRPHVATAGRVELKAPEDLAVTFWLCPGTVKNLQENKMITLIIWDAQRSSGFQIVGRVKGVREWGIQDGYAPGLENARPIPQVSWLLDVKVEGVLEFVHAIHSDAEL